MFHKFVEVRYARNNKNIFYLMNSKLKNFVFEEFENAQKNALSRGIVFTKHFSDVTLQHCFKKFSKNFFKVSQNEPGNKSFELIFQLNGL